MLSIIVVDTGPLIGLFYRKDLYHEESVRGFQELLDTRARIVAPLPIVFEVYKWLLYNIGYTDAHEALDRIRQSLEITEVTTEAFDSLTYIAERMPGWGGSLEDALVVLTARSLGCPAWTFNYRDFSAFKDLELWNLS